MAETFTVTGSYGDLRVDAKTGDVLTYFCEDWAYLPGDDEARGYRDIIRFDVNEWRRYYPSEKLDDQWIDILDIGFWYMSPLGFWLDGPLGYEPAEQDWRDEIFLAAQFDGKAPVIQFHPEKGAEIEYLLPDGSTRYEIAFTRSEAFQFMRMHKATSMRGVKDYL